MISQQYKICLASETPGQNFHPKSGVLDSNLNGHLDSEDTFLVKISGPESETPRNMESETPPFL